MKQYAIKQRRYLLRWKLLLFLLVLCAFSIFASTEEQSLSKGEVSLRVFHLFVDVAEALKKQALGNEDVEYIPCQVNQGCTWIKRPRTETKPHFWQLVSQGTGREFEETNSNEHWLYDVPSTANSAGQHFAIAFGQGEFFETEGRENNGKKNRVIKQEYGEPDFGEKIVRNLVQEPTSSSGYIEGRPFDGLCRDIKGRDFCSLKVRISSVKELIGYCDRLWAYYGQGSGLIYQTLLAEAGNKRLEDVSSLFEGQSIEEGSECKLGVVQAVKVFGKYYTFEGIGEYIERTKKEVQRLIQDDSISLPDFDETELYSSMKESVDEQRDGEEQGDETALRKKRKREEGRIDWEGRYNKKAAEEKGYLLLDKKCVFSHQIEVCDLLVTQPKRLLVHVKRGTDSASLNHLFGQGYASADLLSRSGSSKRIILELLRKEVNEQIAEEMKTRQQQLAGLWQQFSNWREEKGERLAGKAYVVLRDVERFPESKTAFKDFCIALGKFKKDPKAKRMAEQLDQYRVDLIEAHLNSCWDEVLSSMNTENITEIFNHLKVRYRERYDREVGVFLSRDLVGILESEKLRNFKNRLNEGLIPTLNSQENAPNFTVIYGVITAKNAADRNLLPLGARINLLRTVRDLTAQEGEVKFSASLKLIKEK